MNDNVVECSINVNITIAINYFVNINLYFSKSLVVLRFCCLLHMASEWSSHRTTRAAHTPIANMLSIFWSTTACIKGHIL